MVTYLDHGDDVDSEEEDVRIENGEIVLLEERRSRQTHILHVLHTIRLMDLVPARGVR